jgi:hypothetical protein
MIACVQKSIKGTVVRWRFQCLTCHKSGAWKASNTEARNERDAHNKTKHTR